MKNEIVKLNIANFLSVSAPRSAAIMGSSTSQKQARLVAGKSAVLFDSFRHKGIDDFCAFNPSIDENSFYNPFLFSWCSGVCADAYSSDVSLSYNHGLESRKQTEQHVLNRSLQLVNMQEQHFNEGAFAFAIKSIAPRNVCSSEVK